MRRPFLPDRAAFPTLFAAIAFGAGALASPCERPLAPAHFLIVFVVLLAIRTPARGVLRNLPLVLSVALAGHAIQDARHLRQLALQEQLRDAFAVSDRCDLEGRIEDAWHTAGNIRQGIVRLHALSCAGKKVPINALARLTWPPPREEEAIDPPRSGDRFYAHARLIRPSRARNPGALDSASLLAARDILILGRIKSRRLLSIDPEDEPTIPARLSRMRDRALERLRGSMDRLPDAHPATSPLLSALLLGERHGLDHHLRNNLQAAGLYHLVAISGLHVALLAWLLLRVACALGLPPAIRSLAANLVLGTYVLLIGAPASAMRAYGMFALWSCGRHTGRRAGGLSLLLVVSAVMLALRPGLRDDVGYWLSVWATGGIVGSWRGHRGEDEERHARRAPRFSALRVSTSAYLSVAPLAALWFQRWTPLGILLNLLAVPLAGLLFCCALALLALGNTNLAWPIAAAADTGVRLLIEITSCSFFHSEIFRLAPPSAVVLCTHLAASAALWLHATLRPAWRNLLAAAHLALLLPAAPPATGSLAITLWDVGQGESALVSLPDGGHVVVDTAGRLLSGGTAAERWVLPALRTQQVRRVHALALSHLDSDHAAGLEDMVTALRPDEVWVPAGLSTDALETLRASAREHGVRLISRAKGDRWRLGGALFEVLSPELQTPGRSDNAGSLVLRVHAAGEQILLTGDLEASGERHLATFDLEPVSVLKVAHHGSRGSSDTIFLRKVRPRAALISAGARNAWGHPHEEALHRLAAVGACTVSTSDGGAVRARLARGVLRVERWRGSWETFARLAPARWLLPQADRNRHEGDDEDRQSNTQENPARAAERLPAQHRRVTIPDCEEKHQPQQPRCGRHDSGSWQKDENRKESGKQPARGAGQDSVSARRHRIKQVAAVQLSDRKQIEAGGQLP